MHFRQTQNSKSFCRRKFRNKRSKLISFHLVLVPTCRRISRRWLRLLPSKILLDRLRLLTGEVMLDRNGFGIGILSLNPPGWYGTFDPTPYFQGVTILGLQRIFTNQIFSTRWLGITRGNMRGRGEIRGCATKVTDMSCGRG